MRHPRLLPTVVVGLLCAVWFVDHRFMSAKITALSVPAEPIKPQPVLVQKPIDDAVPPGPKTDLIARTLNDVTGSITANQPPKPALHRMKNVSVKARPTSIDGLLN